MRCDRRTVVQNEAKGRQHPPQHMRTQAKKHQNESSNERITGKRETQRNKTEANATEKKEKRTANKKKTRCWHSLLRKWKDESSCLWMIRWLSMTTNSVV